MKSSSLILILKIITKMTINTHIEIRLKNPIHPGNFIKYEVIEPLALSVTSAANILGVSRATLSALLNERAHLSPEMALRIEKAFGVSMDTLMRMQSSYDIAQTRKRAAEIKVAPYSKKSIEPNTATRKN